MGQYTVVDTVLRTLAQMTRWSVIVPLNIPQQQVITQCGLLL